MVFAVHTLRADGGRFLPHRNHLTTVQKVAYFRRSVQRERNVIAWLKSPAAPRTQERLRELRWHREALRYHSRLAVRYAAKLDPAPRVPGWFWPQALCIHHFEGAWNSATGNGYYGGMQFLPSTWARAGGTGLASNASPEEQVYRAYMIWRQDGGSWREWGTAGRCGLR